MSDVLLGEGSSVVRRQRRGAAAANQAVSQLGEEVPPASVTVTLPVCPSANRWWRHVTLKTRTGVRVTTLLSREARQYKARVAEMLAAHRPRQGPVSVTVRWYREIKSGDLDKRLGVLFDALQGVLYENDSQVVQLHAYRYEDPRNPRVVVTVEAV